MIKSTPQLGIDRNFFNFIKVIYKNLVTIPLNSHNSIIRNSSSSRNKICPILIMDKKSEYGFLQRKYTNGHEAYEKIFNIINHQ